MTHRVVGRVLVDRIWMCHSGRGIAGRFRIIRQAAHASGVPLLVRRALHVERLKAQGVQQAVHDVVRVPAVVGSNRDA